MDAPRVADEVLALVMRHRRRAPDAVPCPMEACPECAAPHLARILDRVRRRAPVRFILPGFPGKSPNPTKVLGPLPDMAERLAIRFLAGTCARVREIYPPGAEIIICSDGRVFSDVVGMADHDITAYQDQLQKMIDEEGVGNVVSLYHLDHALSVAERGDFAAVRAEFMTRYGTPIEEVRAEISDNEEARKLYCGITRFLFEDSDRFPPAGSRAARQRSARVRAYGVIQRSNAWSVLLEERFADAVRLSIHPQACGSKKLGVHVMGTADNWLTPWHGVAVDTGAGFVLAKRAGVEAAGAQLVRDAMGRPSHFALYRSEGR